MEEKKKDEKSGLNIDLGFGNLNLGGIFDGIEKLAEAASKLEEMGGEFKKEGEVDLSHLKSGMKGIFGVSVRSGIGGDSTPIVESFGNIKKTPEGPKVEEEREPLTDVFDESDEIIVILEMPGVTQDEIKIDLQGDMLDISAKNKNRKYRKELMLPCAVQADSLTSSYNNGVLEVKMKK